MFWANHDDASSAQVAHEDVSSGKNGYAQSFRL